MKMRNGYRSANLVFAATGSIQSKYSAKETIGDPDKDAAMLKAASPLANASRIKTPVLMAYGAQDYRVPLVHGEKMRDALKANGATVEWVVYREEGHGFWLESNRFDFYERVAKLLAKYNPPN
jgi:dipeptidyl aminopeptidase/acylaminoacyl peptidase